MKFTLFLPALLALSLGPIHAATLATWDGINGASVAGTSVDASIVSVTDLTRGSGLSTGTGGNFNSSSWDTGSDFATALAAGEFISWGMTIDVGLEITGLTITAEVDRSGTGPTSFAFAIDTGSGFTQIGSTLSTPDPGALVTSASVAGPLTGTVNFALVAWGASSGAGTLDIEDDLIDANATGILVSGTVPEPSIALLGGLGILALLRRRR